MRLVTRTCILYQPSPIDVSTYWMCLLEGDLTLTQSPVTTPSFCVSAGLISAKFCGLIEASHRLFMVRVCVCQASLCVCNWNGYSFQMAGSSGCSLQSTIIRYCGRPSKYLPVMLFLFAATLAA